MRQNSKAPLTALVGSHNHASSIHASHLNLVDEYQEDDHGFEYREYICLFSSIILHIASQYCPKQTENYSRASNKPFALPLSRSPQVHLWRLDHFEIVRSRPHHKPSFRRPFLLANESLAESYPIVV